MKFIHTADIHWGAAPESGTRWGIGRDKQIQETFQHLVEVCEQEQIDLLLIAGDLFHKQPLLRDLKEVNYILGKLTHTKVVIIAGNHDYISFRSNLADFEWNSRVTFIKTGQMDSIYFEEINTEVYGFSYTTRDILEAKLDSVNCTVPERINILLGHGGDSRSIPINYNKLLQTNFDYIALGHIHKYCIYDERMAYSGSLEPLDKTELGEHGYIYGEIKKNEESSECHISFVPFCKRMYFQLSVPISTQTTNQSLQEEIKEQIKKQGTSNFYQVILSGRYDPVLHIDEEAIKDIEGVIEVKNQALPDFDFDSLYKENKHNIIGAYIKKIREESDDNSITVKALYYGIEALLQTRER